MNNDFIINSVIFIVIILVLVIILNNPHKENFFSSQRVKRFELVDRYKKIMSNKKNRDVIIKYLKNVNLENIRSGSKIKLN